MEIAQVDVHDEGALRAWYATYLAAELDGPDYPTPWMYPEMVARLQAPAVDKDIVVLSGRDPAGEVVVGGLLELPLKDNLDRAWALVHTHPDHRRRRYGSAMLEAVEGEVLVRGRRRIGLEVGYRYEAGPEGTGVPGIELARRRGYTIALGDVQRVLDLPVDPAVLEALAAEARPHHRGYRLISFVDQCPDDLVESYGRLVGTLTTEAPDGELELEAEVYDAERIRHEESVAAAAGRTTYVVLALDPVDEVVAYSQLVVPRHHPGRVYQWGTLVHPGHRGHRLGLAVKVANHLHLQDREEGVSECLTWNAEVNDHMIGVNDRLGYRKVGRSAELDKILR